ncbi:Xanthine permease [Staphylococcus pseudintermedius]|nr:Xanthine permease [Staphylococcus pseudintermedius]
MKRFLLSLQHLLAMYAGAILVPIIVGTSLNFTPEQIAYLVTVDIFMCGVATFLQVYRGIGIGLPVVLGCTFTAVAPMILIGQTKGIDVLYGSLFLSGFWSLPSHRFSHH